MPLTSPRLHVLRTCLALAFLGGAHAALDAPVAPVHEAAQAQKQGMLDTMRDLVNIESGSKDVEGVERIAELIRVAEPVDHAYLCERAAAMLASAGLGPLAAPPRSGTS